MVWNFVAGGVLLAFAWTLFIWCCLEAGGPDLPEDDDVEFPALPLWISRRDPGSRSGDAADLAAVCALSASVAGVGAECSAAARAVCRK